MLTFLRIEPRGGNLVAVFDRGYSEWEPTGYGGSRYDDGTFCLNEESLRIRIANIKAGLSGPTRNVSVECAALAELLKQKGTSDGNEESK